MNIQELFNRIIDQKYYDTSCNDAAMCYSVATAWVQDVITEEECQFLHKAIEDYLESTGFSYLRGVLEMLELPSTIEARTAIYRDWANRPKLRLEAPDE